MGRTGWWVARALTFVALFVGAGFAGRATVVGPGSLSLVWPAAGVAALWLCTSTRGSRPWDLTLMASCTFLVNVLTGASPLMSAWFVATNLSQTIWFFFLMRRLVPDSWNFGGLRVLGRFTDLGGAQGTRTHLTATVPAAIVRHSSATSARGRETWATARRPSAACPGDLGDRVPALLGGERVVGVAEDLQRPAAQHRGGPRRLVGHRAAEVDQAPARGRAPGSGRGRGRTDDRVDDDVDGPAGTSREQGRHLVGVVVQERRPRRRRPRGPGRRARPDGRRPTTRAGAQHRGRPDRRLADRSARRRGRAPSRPAAAPPARSAHIQAATADSPSAATSVSSGRRRRSAPGRRRATAHRSAMLPSPGAIPARSRTRPGSPAGSASECSTTPTPWTPGTYGHRRRTEVRRTGRAQQVERYDGRGVTRTSARPGAGSGIGVLADPGGVAGVWTRRRARHPQVAMSG